MIRTFARVMGAYFCFFSLALLVPLLVAAYFEYVVPALHPQPHATLAFGKSFLFSLAVGSSLWFWGRKERAPLYRREGIVLVFLIWVGTTLLGSLPFWWSGLLGPLDATFESMSGITTTGSSVLTPKAYDPLTGQESLIHLTNPQVPEQSYSYYGTVPPVRDPQTGLILYAGVEAVSRAILLWRSLLQWIGGVGVVLIFLAILPNLGVGGKFLYQTEMTGPIKEELAPKIQQTAASLWRLYVAGTALAIVLLLATNPVLPLFDAVCLAFSAISTGGFSVRNDSMASYGSLATEGVVLLCMLGGSINFSLYFSLLKGKFSRFLSPDFLLFWLSLGVGISLVVMAIWNYFDVGHFTTYSWQEALRLGAFQAVSIQTTTGFSLANYDLWPFPAQMFLLLLMFVGGMSGSTAGGIKTSRFYILYKLLLHRLESIYRPDVVRKLLVSGLEIDPKQGLTVLSFFCWIAFFVILGSVTYILDGVDPETAFGLIANFLNNIGTAFRFAGPFGSCAFLPPLSKMLSMFWMLLGRLEFFVVLLLFLPNFWKR